MPYTESLHLFFTLFFFIFGSLLGSFSNVVVLRMAISKSVIFPPSACPKCDHQLHAIDLVPIFSWLFLRGKCRYCKAPISIQYPLVESFMAIIICYSFYQVGLDKSGLSFICLASGMAIWFVVSTIFIREEVLRHQPFIWSVIYSIALKYLVIGKIIFNNYFWLALGVAIIVGLIAFIKEKNVEITRWSCLSFLTLFYMPSYIVPYLSIILIFIASLNHIKAHNNKIKWLFYFVQLAGIIANIYLSKTVVLSI